MNILDRYRRLSFWNKFAAWGSIASIVGIGVVLVQLISDNKENLPANQQSVVNSPGSIQVGGDLIIHKTEQVVEGSAKPKVVLPLVQFSTSEGLPTEFQGGTWSHEDETNLRWHKMTISNTNGIDLTDVDVRLQLPEPIKTYMPFERPAGVEVLFEAAWPEFAAIGTSTRIGERGLTGVWKLKISRLPAQKQMSISFFTTNGAEAENYLSSRKSSEEVRRQFSGPTQKDEDRVVRNHLKGAFSHMVDGRSINREVYVIIDADNNKRTISSRPAQETKGDFKFRKIDFSINTEVQYLPAFITAAMFA